MKAYLETLMKHVKSQIDTLRAELASEFVKALEGDENTEGTYYYLQSKLVDGFIRKTKPDAVDLTDLSKKVNAVFHELVKKCDAVAAGVVADSDAEKKFWLYEHYGDVFVQMAFYDSYDGADIAGAAYADRVAGAGAAAQWVAPLWGGERMWNLTRGVKDEKSSELKDISPKYKYQMQGFSDSKYADESYLRSIFFRFNEALHTLLRTFYDLNSNRIYVGLVQSLANGIFSDMVMGDDRGWLDTDAQTQAFGVRGDPKAGNILFRSTAAMMRNMVLDRDRRTNTNLHLIDTMSEVPPYMKEKMRSNLPLFNKLFSLMVEKIEFLKTVADRTSVRLDRRYQLAAAPAGTSVSQGGLDLASPNLQAILVAGDTVVDGNDVRGNARCSGKQVKLDLSTLLDRISAGSYAVQQVCSTVLKEVIDAPVFHQVGEGSIKEFHTRYGRLPFMPLSLASVYLDPSRLADEGVVSSLFPDNTIGTDSFKMEYGIRGLLLTHEKLSGAKMPGVEKILDAYNSVVGRTKQMPKDKYMEFVSLVVKSLRCVGIDRYFMGLMDMSSDAWREKSLLQPPNLRLWETRRDVSLRAIINAIESNQQEETVQTIVKSVGRELGAKLGQGLDSREEVRKQNLFDLDIVPINLYALMRQIPLTNLYAYDMGFDDLAHTFMGLGEPVWGQGAGLDIQDYRSASREAFVKMLMQPYAHVDAGRDYGVAGAAMVVSPLKLMMNGADGLHFGRPKYISDQLLNKVLLGQMYMGAEYQMEAGPGVGSALAVNTPGYRGATLNAGVPDLAGTLGRLGGVGVRSNPNQLSFVMKPKKATDLAHVGYTDFGADVSGLGAGAGFNRFKHNFSS